MRPVPLAVALLLAAAAAALVAAEVGATPFPGPDTSPQKYRGQDTIGTGTGPILMAPTWNGYSSIETTGVDLTLANDAFTTSCIDLGFDFYYYDMVTPYDCVWIHSNGFMVPSTTGSAAPTATAAETWTPVALPATSDPDAIIAPFWVDTNGSGCAKVDTTGNGGIYYRSTATEFILEFKNVLVADDNYAGACINDVPSHPNPVYVTWQAKLYAATWADIRANAIDFLLVSVQEPNISGCDDAAGALVPCWASVGIEDGAGSLGLGYSFTKRQPTDTAPRYTNLGIRFWPNHAPSYVPTTATVLEDAAAAVPVVLTADPDMDGDGVSCTATQPTPVQGVLSGPFDPVSGSCVRSFQPGLHYCNQAPPGPGLAISYTAVDALGTSPPVGPGYTDIRVTCVNDPPTIGSGAAVPAVPAGFVANIPNWVAGITPGPPEAVDEAGQDITFPLQAGLPSGSFSTLPTLTRTGGTASLSYVGAVAGTYNVCFTAKDDGGTASGGGDTSITTACTLITITPLGPDGQACSSMTPDFAVTTGELHYAQSIAFTDRSTGDVTRWAWTFGDGHSSSSDTTAAAHHAYASPGDYTVRLTVQDESGCVASVDRLLHIVAPTEGGGGPAVLPEDDGNGIGPGSPVPTVTADDKEVKEGSLVILKAEASNIASDSAAYRWRQTGGPAVTLDDAGTARPRFTAPRLADPAHPTYLIFAVRVTNGFHESADAYMQVTVVAQNHAPVANAGPDVTVAKGGSTLLTSRSHDADLDELVFRWVVVDGPALASLPSDQSSISVKIPAETTAAYVDVRLEVSDGQASSRDTMRIWIQVPGSTQVAGFRATPRSDGSVAFDANVQASEYVWDFGDGTEPLRTTDIEVTHQYARSGLYPVTLSLGGAAEAQTMPVQVAVPEEGSIEPAGDGGIDIIVAIVSAIGAALLVGGLLSWSLRQRGQT